MPLCKPVFDSAVAGGDRHAKESEVSKEQAILADKDLAQRCVAGEVIAWQQLHNQCHDRLVRTIGALLRGRSQDSNLADEIAARVWYALVANDGELLMRYDPTRGARLITFMRAIARDIISRHYRSERRRIDRECEALLERPRHHSSHLDEIDVSLDEFLGTLTPAERNFCGEYLLNLPDGDATTESRLSRANLWQKTHRLYARFRKFFEA
jgi:hypothetical protein